MFYLQDLVYNLRVLFQSRIPQPAPAQPPPDTDAPDSTLSSIVQVLWFTTMFISEEDWPGAWHNTLTADQMSARKTDKAAVPRGAGLAEFMALATDADKRAACLEAAEEIYEQRADLFGPLFPGIEVSSKDARHKYMDAALCKLPALSVAQIHELVTSTGTAISKAMSQHKHSGHVEDLPVEVSIPKSTPPAKLAVQVWVTYLAHVHDSGLEGVIYKNFSKAGRDGAGGSGDSTIERGQNGSRTGSMSAADKLFHQQQTQRLLDVQPCKKKVEAAFDAIATLADPSSASQPASDAQFLLEQEQAIMGPNLTRPEGSLTADEKTLVDEIRGERATAIRQAIADRKRARE